jgi:SnoaL-like domain
VAEPIEAVVLRLADENAIAKVVLNYARGVDRRQFDLVRSCFAPGAHIAGTNFTGPVDDYLPKLVAGLAPFPRTVHFIGNHFCEVEGDLAHSETYAVARQFTDPDGVDEAVVVGVRYLDQWARQPDRTWAITARQVEADWRRIRPAASP